MQSSSPARTLDDILGHPAIQALIADPSLSQAKVAQANGVAQTTVAHWLSVLREQKPEVLPSHLKDKVVRAAPLTLNDILNKPAVQAMFKDPSLTQTKAADLFDTPQPHLSRWLGRIAAEAPELLPDHLKKIKPRPKPGNAGSGITHLGSTYAYPVITRISAGAFNGSSQADHEPVGAYHSTRLVKPRVVDGAARQPFAVQVSGHAMTNPASQWDFPHGTLALCDPGCMPDLNDFVAVVDLTDETLALRQLVNRARLPERDLWLVALNPDPAYAAIKLDDGMHAVAGVVLEAYLPKYARK